MRGTGLQMIKEEIGIHVTDYLVSQEVYSFKINTLNLVPTKQGVPVKF